MSFRRALPTRLLLDRPLQLALFCVPPNLGRSNVDIPLRSRKITMSHLTPLYSPPHSFHAVSPHDAPTTHSYTLQTDTASPSLPYLSILPPPHLTPLKTSHKSSTHHHNTTQLHTSNISLHSDALYAKSHICAHSQLNLTLHKYVIFEENANLMSAVNLEIGPYVIFGAGCVVNYPLAVGSHIYIGRNVTIEKNVRIASGVRVEDDSVVEEGTILESGFVYKGSPVRVVGTWMETKGVFERYCRDLYTKGVGWRDLRNPS